MVEEAREEEEEEDEEGDRQTLLKEVEKKLKTR